MVRDSISKRTSIVQRKTGRPVQFEITAHTRSAVSEWIKCARLRSTDYVFPSQVAAHLSTRQYARLLSGWLSEIGLDSRLYGTHSLRRTKVALIYRKTKNLRAIQLLLAHTKLDSTVRYLGIELDDALELAEQTEL
jgi:site-specific recombinase XerC